MSHKNNSTRDQTSEEARLNPVPFVYRVPFVCKLIFVVLACLGIALYLFMVIERRHSQQKFLVHNQIAAVELVKTKAPDFLVTDPHNIQEKKALSQFFGGWTLLNLWATWCPPCQKEMPSLALLQKKLAGKLKIVALSVDDQIDAVQKFISTNNPGFVVLWDQNKSSETRFGVSKYPETFLISPDGQLMMQFSGPRDWASDLAVEFFQSIIE